MLTLAAGARMRALRSYGFVFAVTIATLAIGLMACGVVGAVSV